MEVVPRNYKKTKLTLSIERQACLPKPMIYPVVVAVA